MECNNDAVFTVNKVFYMIKLKMPYMSFHIVFRVKVFGIKILKMTFLRNSTEFRILRLTFNRMSTEFSILRLTP